MTAAGLMLGMVGTDSIDRAGQIDVRAFPSSWTASVSCRSRSGCSGLRRSSATLASPGVQPTVNRSDRRSSGPTPPRPGARPRRRCAAPLSGRCSACCRVAVPSSRRSRRTRSRRSCRPRRPALGSGAIEGVAGPESANNAAAQTSFVPLLTLGLAIGSGWALLLGALIVHGIQPGPDVISKEPALFWGLVASMWIGNVMLLVLNLPLVGWWARLARVPYRYLYPTTVALSCTGIYALSHSTFDLLLAALFGVIGYLLRTRGFEPAPLLLGFVLSQPLHDNLNRALVFANGDLTTFVEHPLSAVLLAVAAASLLVTALPAVKHTRALLEGGRQ